MKVPPNNAEIERVVLGAIMVDSNCVPVIMSKLFPEAFYAPSHVLIFKAICQLYDSVNPIDIITVCSRLEKNKELEKVGGGYEVVKMTNAVVSSAHIEEHILLLLELYLKRQTAEIGQSMYANAHDLGKDAFDGLNDGAAAILRASEAVIRGQQKSMTYYVGKLNEQRDRIQETGQIGLDTGLKAINKALCGWVSPDFVVLAARPGMGKTALMLSSLHHMAVENHKAVAVFSLEMSGEQLTQRLESIDSGISHHALRTNRLSTEERSRLLITQDRLIKSPIFIESKPGLNIRELRTKCNLLKRRNDIGCIMLDYLQLMSGVDEKNKSRENIISEISRGCKGIANELNIPVIALSQLSRQVESRSDKLPQLSDLRESGSIEQDADEVIFLMRPEYYGMNEPVEIGGQSYDTPGLVICKIDKNRHGATKNIPLRFNAETMRFGDYQEEFQTSNWRPVKDWNEKD